MAAQARQNGVRAVHSNGQEQLCGNSQNSSAVPSSAGAVSIIEEL